MLHVSKFERSAPWAADQSSPSLVVSQIGTPDVATRTLALRAITTLEDFEALRDEWDGLFARAGRPDQVFQTFNWCRHWCQHFLAPAASPSCRTSLAIMTGWRQGRMIMAWPLVHDRGRFVSRLTWLGEPVGQYGDVLLDHLDDASDVLAAGWRAIADTFKPDLIHLRKVREDATIARVLTGAGGICLSRDEAPYLDLSSAPDAETYEQRYSAKARKNRRRLLRRLEEQGGVRVETMASNAAAADIAERAIVLKRAWLKARGLVSPAIASDRTLDFFGAVAGDRDRPVGCQVSCLTVNETPAAIQVAFACRAHLAMHVIVYDLAFEKAGVGVLHIEAAIRQAYRDGIARIDLLAPHADYKMEWADGTVGVGDYAKPLTIAGYAFTRGYLSFFRRRIAAFLGKRTGSASRLRSALTAGILAVL